MRAILIVEPLYNNVAWVSRQFKTSISVTSKFLNKMRTNLIVKPLYNNVAWVILSILIIYASDAKLKFKNKMRANLIVEPLYNNVARVILAI